MSTITLKLFDGDPDHAPYLSDPVRDLQKLLQRWGFDVSMDGYYGPSTESAVLTFQRRMGLTDTGSTCALTWQALLGTPTPIGAGWHPLLSTPFAKATDGSGKNPILCAIDAPSNEGIRLEVPWYSQFDTRVPGAGNTACMRACRLMAKAGGAVVLEGLANCIRVATNEDQNGHVDTDPARLREGIAYIDTQLKNGKPVVVGVAHQAGSPNADGITDHFVVITGRVIDNGKVVYLYNDPAPSVGNEKFGRNQLRVDEKTGNLVHDGKVAKGYVHERHTELSLVVKNKE